MQGQGRPTYVLLISLLAGVGLCPPVVAQEAHSDSALVRWSIVYTTGSARTTDASRHQELVLGAKMVPLVAMPRDPLSDLPNTSLRLIGDVLGPLSGTDEIFVRWNGDMVATELRLVYEDGSRLEELRSYLDDQLTPQSHGDDSPEPRWTWEGQSVTAELVSLDEHVILTVRAQPSTG